MQIIPNDISEKKKISEMEAVEMVAYCADLLIKICKEIATPEEKELYQVARKNYKELTGRFLWLSEIENFINHNK
jgi:hypothetical protein